MKPEWRAAAGSDDVGALERLLAAAYDIDARDEHGQTALMLAAREGKTAAARCLIEHGADLDHTAKFHLTALMLAVINGRLAIVQALVAAGADLTVRGSGAPGFHEKTALDLALAALHGESGEPWRDAIVGILRAAGAPQGGAGS